MVISARRASDPIRPTAAAASTPAAPSTAVIEPLPNRPEPSEPEPNERLCCQCQHFSQSPYGPPLGLCVEYGNRIQHSTSEPACFGCSNFEPKEGLL